MENELKVNNLHIDFIDCALLQNIVNIYLNASFKKGIVFVKSVPHLPAKQFCNS